MIELVYNRINWVNGSGTPLNDSNLNKMDIAILDLVNRSNTHSSAIDEFSTVIIPRLEEADSKLEQRVQKNETSITNLSTKSGQLDTDLKSLTTTVGEIEGTVGNGTTGLVKSVNDLKSSKADVVTTTNLQNQLDTLAGQVEDWEEHTHATATTSSNGFFHYQDKIKLDGIEAGATNVEVENVLTSDSTTNALSAAQGKLLKGSIGTLTTELENVKSTAESANSTSMKKSVYDTDGDGVVDNSKKFDGKDLSYFATAESVRSIQNALENVEGISVSWKAF